MTAPRQKVNPSNSTGFGMRTGGINSISKPLEFEGFRNNTEFIRMALPQPDRLVRLNEIAIRQLQSLTARDVAKTLGAKSEAGTKPLEVKKPREKKDGAA